MRKLMKAAVLLVALALAAAACGGAPVAADENGEIIITMSEFSFSPNNIEVSPGETVTFVLVNEGEKEHEFMAGRDVQTVDGETVPFAIDFFEGLEPMVMPMDAVMNMDDMDDMEMTEGSMAMTEGSMAMTDDSMPMTDDSMAMEDAGHDGHTGFMIAREPNEEARLTITIPADASGVWEFGCFEEDGAHWDDGMRGTITIVASA